MYTMTQSTNGPLAGKTALVTGGAKRVGVGGNAYLPVRHDRLVRGLRKMPTRQHTPHAKRREGSPPHVG